MTRDRAEWIAAHEQRKQATGETDASPEQVRTSLMEFEERTADDAFGSTLLAVRPKGCSVRKEDVLW